MRLENYIMEQDINTASVADIFVEQAQAEMNVIASIVESYTKETIMDQYIIQEGAIKDAATVAKGSKHESKIKRVVAFLPRFFAQLFKLVVAKLKKVNNPIQGMKAKFAKVPEEVKKEAVIPITKENLEFASKVMNELEKIFDRNKFEDLFKLDEVEFGSAKGNGQLLKISENVDKFTKVIENYNVEERVNLALKTWKNSKDKQDKENPAYGKTVMNVKVDDGSPASNKPSMPDIVIKTPETKDLATIKEFEEFAEDFVDGRVVIEKSFKEIMSELNKAKTALMGSPETTKSGVTIAQATSDDVESDTIKYFDQIIKSYNKLSAAFTKLFDSIEKTFTAVLKDTKAYKAYKQGPKKTSVPDEDAAAGYKIDVDSVGNGNWGSSKTRSGGDYGREPKLGDSPERIESFYLK